MLTLAKCLLSSFYCLCGVMWYPTTFKTNHSALLSNRVHKYIWSSNQKWKECPFLDWGGECSKTTPKIIIFRWKYLKILPWENVHEKYDVFILTMPNLKAIFIIPFHIIFKFIFHKQLYCPKKYVLKSEKNWLGWFSWKFSNICKQLSPVVYLNVLLIS